MNENIVYMPLYTVQYFSNINPVKQRDTHHQYSRPKYDIFKHPTVKLISMSEDMPAHLNL